MEEIRIGPDDAGQRFDRFLRKLLKGATLPTVYKLIRTKQATLNGRKGRPEKRLEPGDVVRLYPAERRMADLRRSSALPTGDAPVPSITVLHEDRHILAVAKPPFLLVHDGDVEGEATLIDGVRAYLGPSGARTFEPGLAHRLDRQTSGVVLVGKTAVGLRGLTAALRRGDVTKSYLALVLGEVAGEQGVIDVPLLRLELRASDRPRVRVDHRRGKIARTDYRVLARAGGMTLVLARPRTGRTHQLRVHFRHLGHAILGDATYGDEAANRRARGRHGLWRQWLHAFAVDLAHPVSGKPLRIEAPLPEDLLRCLTEEGFSCDALPEGALSEGGGP